MTVIHFTGQVHEKDTTLYHVNINGTVYYYNRYTDKLWNVQTGKIIDRLGLPGDVLRAFHEAWNPDAYAIVTPPMDRNGIPDDTENPDSPLYSPAKPQGEPMEIRSGYVGERAGRRRRGVRTPH